MSADNSFLDVLHFWFGELSHSIAIPDQKTSMWFADGKDYDGVIREKFGQLHQRACHGELDAWQHESKSLLSLIITLDQFSRHIYRKTAQAFSQDARCLSLVESGINKGLDQSLYLIERKFFYMPLMHAEDLNLQNLSVKMFSQLRDQAPLELKEFYGKTLSFAESHHFVINKFGRFPELNSILGRSSTREEEAFLETGKYQFL